MKSRICVYPTCTNRHYGKGYCVKHYQRLIRYGSPDITKREPNRNQHLLPEYRVWENMKMRCYNSKSDSYKNYGGRGIIVCERWRSSFITFYADMGSKPSLEHSIERKDVNGNYEPINCIWATKAEQALNKRLYSNNTSGYRGLIFSRGRWVYRKTVNGKRKYSGSFATKEEAISAIKKRGL